jgi:hypothetical protein
MLFINPDAGKMQKLLRTMIKMQQSNALTHNIKCNKSVAQSMRRLCQARFSPQEVHGVTIYKSEEVIVK